MKTAGVFFVSLLLATPAFAQHDRGYLQGTGGFDVSSTAMAASSFSTGSGAAQGGVKVAKHVLVFGEFGRFHDLQPTTVQSNVDQTVQELSTDQGLVLVGTSKMPTGYGMGGVRVFGKTRNRVTPYAMAGFGSAHLKPEAAFAYSSGTLPGSDPTAPVPPTGSDVTSEVVNSGTFTQPSTENAFMYSLGGGISVGLGKRWTGDVGYRYSHISATDTPLHTQGMTFGVGVRF